MIANIVSLNEKTHSRREGRIEGSKSLQLNVCVPQQFLMSGWFQFWMFCDPGIKRGQQKQYALVARLVTVVGSLYDKMPVLKLFLDHSCSFDRWEVNEEGRPWRFCDHLPFFQIWWHWLAQYPRIYQCWSLPWFLDCDLDEWDILTKTISSKSSYIQLFMC